MINSASLQSWPSEGVLLTTVGKNQGYHSVCEILSCRCQWTAAKPKTSAEMVPPWLLDEKNVKCAPQPEAPGQVVSPFSQGHWRYISACCLCSTLRVVVFWEPPFDCLRFMGPRNAFPPATKIKRSRSIPPCGLCTPAGPWQGQERNMGCSVPSGISTL